MHFFFQAEDGIRDRSPSRGLGDVYKRQILKSWTSMAAGKERNLQRQVFFVPKKRIAGG